VHLRICSSNDVIVVTSSGWSNADYWNDQLGQCHPSFPEISTYAKKLSEEFSVNDRVNRFCLKIIPPSVVSHDPLLASVGTTSPSVVWNPSLFLGLCMDAFRNNDEGCIAYCESVTTEEYRSLLRKYAAKLGLDSSAASRC
jgi:hypothetical protein